MQCASESPHGCGMPLDPKDSSSLKRISVAQRVVLGQRARLEADTGNVSSQWKQDGSRVTETDHAISSAILTELAHEFPEDQGLSEELLDKAPVNVTSRFTWVLDPIDGTNNFAMGLAQCAISLALLEDGQPVYGVIYDVSRKVLMHGGPGFGMWDGERAGSVSMKPLTRDAIVGFHSPHQAHAYEGHADLLVGASKLRALGSSALHLAYVAAGFYDGVVDHNVKLWDIAAGIPMLQAAGGEVRFLANDPLPLRRFDLEMPKIFYVGGNANMIRALATLFDGDA
jgi:myo-inositol-1(or 4)-monophosphatase